MANTPSFRCRNKPEIEQSLLITKEVKKMKDSLLWGFANAAVLSVFVYDIIYTCPLYSPITHVVERVVAGVLALNVVFHFCRYCWTSFTLQPVSLTPRQKTLLGIKDTDYYLRTLTATSTPVKAAGTPIESADVLCVTPLNMSFNSWLSSQYSPSDSMRSSNFNSSLPSWPSPISQVYKSSAFSPAEVIQDQSALLQYLREFESFERSSIVENSLEQPTNMLSSFWSHPASRQASDVSPLLRRCTYQLSLSPAKAQSGVGTGDEAGSPSTYQHSDVWHKNKINPTVITEWVSNLRMWVSQTILERLVGEMSRVDIALHGQGLVDVSVGVVGLERLQKTAQIPQVALNVPTLARLTPFLEISQNQEYVVARIKELARGGCMSEYRWNGGGKNWTPALPTDAALVLHLLATYLDSQLPGVALPDSRPFSSHYLVKCPNKPVANQLCIVQTSVDPPNYVLQTPSETFYTPKGRNNLFFTILLFLHVVKTREHGILGRINLGRSGVNLLWCIDKDS